MWSRWLLAACARLAVLGGFAAPSSLVPRCGPFGLPPFRRLFAARQSTERRRRTQALELLRLTHASSPALELLRVHVGGREHAAGAGQTGHELRDAEQP